MIQKETWYIEALQAQGPRTLQHFRRMPNEQLYSLLERPTKHYKGQTQEDWFREKDEIYQVLVERGELEGDVTEDVEQRRIKWREWYRRKTQEDPEYHKRYVDRAKERNRNMTPKQKRERSKKEIERQRWEYKTDPQKAEEKRRKVRERYELHKKRMQEDPEYAEEHRRKDREKQRRRQERLKKQSSKVESEISEIREALRKLAIKFNLSLEEDSSRSKGSVSTYWTLYPKTSLRSAHEWRVRYGLHAPYKGKGTHLEIASPNGDRDIFGEGFVLGEKPLEDTLENEFLEHVDWTPGWELP